MKIDTMANQQKQQQNVAQRLRILRNLYLFLRSVIFNRIIIIFIYIDRWLEGIRYTYGRDID